VLIISDVLETCCAYYKCNKPFSGI